DTGCVSNCWALYTDTTGLGHITLRYMEVLGIGNQSTIGPFEEEIRFVGDRAIPGSGCQNCTLQHLYMHNSSSAFLQMEATDTLLIENSIFDLMWGTVV